MKKFEVGKEYSAELGNGHVVVFNVISRTTKTVALQRLGKVYKKRINFDSSKYETVLFDGFEVAAE